jgi:hypothetical protein
LITKVNINIKTTGRKDLNTILKGIFDSKTITKVTARRNEKDKSDLQKNTEIIYIVASKIFVLPSKL